MGRFENAEVFRDTERMCRENARLREAIAASRKGQRLVPSGGTGMRRRRRSSFRRLLPSRRHGELRCVRGGLPLNDGLSRQFRAANAERNLRRGKRKQQHKRI